MKRDIAEDSHFVGKIESGTYFDFSTPYGYGGWLIEGEDSDNLFPEYVKWCKRNNIVCEFVRFHPMLENQHYSEEAYDVIRLGETVALDLTSYDMIWSNLKSTCRNRIRNALKIPVQVYNGRFPEIFKKFPDIYDLTMDKDNADPYYYFEPDFYDSILNDLPEEAQIFYAQIPDGKIIAAVIMLECNGYMNYHLSCSLPEYSKIAATNMIIYQAALWGSRHGFRSLYLGGGVGSEEDNLLRFKKTMYKGEKGYPRFYIGKKVFDKEAYDQLCNMRGINSNSDGFFPRYRTE